jgi:hypothetical protein
MAFGPAQQTVRQYRRYIWLTIENFENFNDSAPQLLDKE